MVQTCIQNAEKIDIFMLHLKEPFRPGMWENQEKLQEEQLSEDEWRLLC